MPLSPFSLSSLSHFPSLSLHHTFTLSHGYSLPHMGTQSLSLFITHTLSHMGTHCLTWAHNLSLSLFTESFLKDLSPKLIPPRRLRKRIILCRITHSSPDCHWKRLPINTVVTLSTCYSPHSSISSSVSSKS